MIITQYLFTDGVNELKKNKSRLKDIVVMKLFSLVVPEDREK